MAKLIHFTATTPDSYREFVYIAEGDDIEDLEAEMKEDGYEISGTIDLDDWELGGFPTERRLIP